MEPEASLNVAAALIDCTCAKDAASRIASILQHRKVSSPSIDEALIWVEKGNGGFGGQELLDVLRSLSEPRRTELRRAFLLSPSAYELPWKCCVQSFSQPPSCRPLSQSEGEDVSRSSTTANLVSTFLQRAVTGWLDEERRRLHTAMARTVSPKDNEARSMHSPRFYWLQLVELLCTTKASRTMDAGNVNAKRIEQNSALQVAGTLSAHTSRDDIDDGKRNKLMGCFTFVLPVRLSCPRLELLSTMVFLSHSLDATLFDSVMDRLYPCSAAESHQQETFSWECLHLAAHLRSLLRPQDWRFLRQWINQQKQHKQLIRDQQQQQHQLTFSTTLPALAHSIMLLVRERTRNEVKTDCLVNELADWWSMLCCLLQEAATTEPSCIQTKQATHAAIEQVIYDQVVMASLLTLQLWLSSLMKKNQHGQDSPRTMAAFTLDVLLLFARAHAETSLEEVTRLLSQVLSAGVKEAFKSNDRDEDFRVRTWRFVVHLGLGMSQSRDTISHLATSEEVIDRLEFIAYDRMDGKFVSDKGGAAFAEALTATAIVIRKSLCPSGVETESDATQSTRAKTLFLLALSQLDGLDLLTEASTSMMIVVVCVVVLCGFTATHNEWTKLCRRLLASSSSSSPPRTAELLVCQVLRLIAGCSLKRDSSYALCDSLFGLLRTPLHRDLFCGLMRALSLLSGGPSKLLDVAREKLASVPSDLEWLTLINSQDAKDATENACCGLFALSWLCAKPQLHWTDSEYIAFSIISDAIVINQPKIPHSSRIWLYQHIKTVCESQLSSALFLDHIYCACLFRLSSAILLIHPDGKVESFREHWGYDGELHVENLSDMPELIDMLLLFLRRSCSESAEFVQSCRSAIVGALCSDQGIALETNDVYRPSASTASNFLVRATLFCLCLIVEQMLDAHVHKSWLKVVAEDINAMAVQLRAHGRISFAAAPKWTQALSETDKNLEGSIDCMLMSYDPRPALCDALAAFIGGASEVTCVAEIDGGLRSVALRNLLVFKTALTKTITSATYESCTKWHLDEASLAGVVRRFCEQALWSSEKDGRLNEDSNTGTVWCVRHFAASIALFYADERKHAGGVHAWSLFCSMLKLQHFVLSASAKCLMTSLYRKTDDLTLEPEIARASGDACIRDFLIVLLRAATACILVLDELKGVNLDLVDLRYLDAQDLDEYLLASLSGLCSSVHAGFDGQNGGLTEEMLMLYVDIGTFLMKSLSRQFLGKWGIVTIKTNADATGLLQSVLYFYPLKTASSMRKYFVFAFHVMPKLTRSIVLDASLSNAVRHNLNTVWTLEAVVNVLNQCLSIFAKQTASEGKQSWVEKIGREHSNIYLDREMVGQESNKDTSDENSAVASSSRVSGPYLQVPSFRVWNWLVLASIDVIDLYYGETQEAMKLEALAFPSERSMIQYYEWKTREHKTVWALVQRLVGSGLARESPICVDLPDTVTLRCASMTGTVLRTLLLAFRFFERNCDHPDGARCVAPVETIAFLSSWASDLPVESDMFAGISTWATTASANPPSESVQSSKSSVLKQLRKCTSLMFECQHVLAKVVQKLKLGSERTEHSLQYLHAFEAVDGASLLDKIILKQTFWERQRLASEADGLGISMEECLAMRERKRKVNEEIGQDMKRERRRRTLRSRNRVVDAWLRKDRGTGDEGVDDDAFEDLEDFLVEG